METCGSGLERFIFEGEDDIRKRARRIGYFLSEYVQMELGDRGVAVHMEYLAEDGDVCVRAEKALLGGYSVVFYTEKKKAYQLETKADVLTWIADIIKGIRRKYEGMPAITFRE